jgi:catechol 2,3-dioxygenase-like lactoylglutathione lyase family enzyme
MREVAPNFVIVTLGVADLDGSIAFYRALGWELRGDRAQGIVWFRTSGTWIGLFPVGDLAEDVGLPRHELPAFRGITLAVNLPSEAEVDAACATWVEVGGKVVKPATRAPWGGYSSYVADPDGHLWELCCNPGFPLDEHGRIEIA